MTELTDNAGEHLSGSPRRTLVIAFLWLLFLGGLALQAFSPHLAIEHNVFIIPADTTPGTIVNPRELVLRERSIQGASAALVLIGAAGLALSYRGVLRRSLLSK